MPSPFLPVCQPDFTVSDHRELNTPAICLKSIDWKEANRLTFLLTPDQGLVKASARGAKKPNSKLAGVTQPISQHRVSLHKIGIQADHSDWWQIRQYECLNPYAYLKTNYDLLIFASIACELCLRLVEAAEETHQNTGGELYHHLATLLEKFDRTAHHAATPHVPLWANLMMTGWMIRLLDLEGWLPPHDQCLQCATLITPASIAQGWWWSLHDVGLWCPRCAQQVRNLGGNRSMKPLDGQRLDVWLLGFERFDALEADEASDVAAQLDWEADAVTFWRTTLLQAWEQKLHRPLASVQLL